MANSFHLKRANQMLQMAKPAEAATLDSSPIVSASFAVAFLFRIWIGSISIDVSVIETIGVRSFGFLYAVQNID